jgi:uncharacterized membrane protein YedE/YeeE
MQLPNTRLVDRRLVIGSVVFGAAWGLAGFCPGPALVAAGVGEAKAILFVLAMLAGMGVGELLDRVGHPPGVQSGLSQRC